MIGPQDKETRNLMLALELHQAGEDLKRQSLRRDHPQATEAEIERLVLECLHTRPGASRGDCPGRAITLDDRAGG